MTFPVSSGNILNGICPAEVVFDTAPKLNGGSLFQFSDRSLSVNQRPGCLRSCFSVHEGRVTFPVLSGNHLNSICPAEVLIDTAPTLKGSTHFQFHDRSTATHPPTIENESLSNFGSHHLGTVSVLSGKIDQSICLAEAGKDTAPSLKSVSRLQSSNTANNRPAAIGPPLASLLVDPLAGDVHRVNESTVTTVAGCNTYHLASFPTVSGKSESGICHAEAGNDTAPNVSESSPLQHAPSWRVQPTAVNALQCSSSNNLLIYYQNVRGLRTKIDDFYLATAESKFDVIVLTETWLDERIYSAQLFGSQYTVFRNDRNQENSTKSRGGGVLIAINRRLCCSLDSSPISSSLEQIWVKIKGQYRSLSLGVLYLPPDRKSDLECIHNHVNSIGNVLGQLALKDLALIFGDYNQSNLVWIKQENKPPTIDILRSSISASCSALLDGFSLHG